MRYEILVRCDFEMFVALRVFADCIFFSSERFSRGPYYLWNLIDILSLQHYVISWKVNLGLACFCVYLRGKYRKLWSRENHDVRRSRLFTYEEPESSVRYRSSCLRSEVRSFLYAAWHSVVRKTNDVALCHAVESEFGISLHLCIFTRKIQNILV